MVSGKTGLNECTRNIVPDYPVQSVLLIRDDTCRLDWNFCFEKTCPVFPDCGQYCLYYMTCTYTQSAIHFHTCFTLITVLGHKWPWPCHHVCGRWYETAELVYGWDKWQDRVSIGVFLSINNQYAGFIEEMGLWLKIIVLSVLEVFLGCVGLIMENDLVLKILPK